MEHTLQIELILDRTSAEYKRHGLQHVMDVFTVLLSESNEPQFVGRGLSGNREVVIFDMDVPDDIFDSFSTEYGVFLENYFGHIPLADYAVVSVRVDDAKVINELLRNFLCDYSLDLQKSM